MNPSPSGPRSGHAIPLDALWQAPVIVWVVMVGEGLAAILSMAPAIGMDRLAYFGLASLTIQWVLLLTLGGLYLLRRRIGGLRPLHVALIGLALLVTAAWLVCAAAWLILANYGYPGRNEWDGILLRVTGIALTTGLIGLAAFHSHWRKRQLAVLAKQSELDALRARIQPHFLFNTLNTGVALVRQHPADAEQLLLNLSDLFRAALVGSHLSSLEQELTLARRYLDIESLRFGERLHMEWQLPATLPSVVMPTLSIQPLIENAIRHGIEPSPQGGHIRIEVAAHEEVVRIVIRNTIPPPGTPPRDGHRIGIQAVRARLEALPGKPGKLETHVDANGYAATINLMMPK